MAKGKKFGGRDWPKGHSGNPKGRRPIPDDVKQLRTENRLEVERLVNQYWMLGEPICKQKLDDPKTPLRDKLILRVILRGIAKGDAATLGFLTDFIFGEKIKQLKVDHNSSDGSLNPQVIVMLPPKDA